MAYDWRADFDGENVFIPQGWEPTAEKINSLPMPLRHFIHMLSTECDPAGTIREKVLIKEQNYALLLKLREQAGESK